MAVAAESAEDRRAAGEVGGEWYSVFQNNIVVIVRKV